MTTTRLLDKGGKLEEVLREYFLELGYFVVRGAKYRFDGCDVTDVDLWLYQRASRFDRRRFNVDAKSKSTPKALERVLWAKGLQVCLGLNGAIVATKDTRQAVKRFADDNEVILLDGSFLSKLQTRYKETATRISEEDLVGIIGRAKSDHVAAAWITKLDTLKSRVLNLLDFDGCNSSLNDIKFFIEQIATIAERREVACRLLYLSIAIFLIGIDYILKDYSFIERKSQIDCLNEGLRYGNLGKAGAEKIFAAAGKLAAGYLKNQQLDGRDLVKQLRDESLRLPVEILSEFLTNPTNNKSFFSLAKAFEEAAYSRNLKTPANLEIELQAILGVLLDFLDVERKSLYGEFALAERQEGNERKAAADRKSVVRSNKEGRATQLEMTNIPPPKLGAKKGGESGRST